MPYCGPQSIRERRVRHVRQESLSCSFSSSLHGGGGGRKTFGFKPTSRKDHFEFIMKGINDRNQVFDIGSKVFPFTDVNSQEEYLVKIEVPEIDNEEVIAAYIHAKIVLYWSDYNYYDKQRRKAESKLKKLNSAMNKLADYLKKLREIYGDLTKKKTRFNC